MSIISSSTMKRLPLTTLHNSAKRHRYDIYVNDMDICVVCMESSLLYVSACKEHFICLCCYTEYLSHTELEHKCPMCRQVLSTTMDVECVQSIEDRTVVFEGWRGILLPSRDMNMLYGEKGTVTCPGCSLEDRPRNIIEHYFTICGGCSIYCRACNQGMTRRGYTTHLEEKKCRTQQCSQCEHLLYDTGHADHDRLLDHHTRMHKYYNTVFSATELIAETHPEISHTIPSADPGIQRIMSRYHDIYAEYQLLTMQVMEYLLRSLTWDTTLSDLFKAWKKTANQTRAIIYAIGIIQNETVDGTDEEED